MTSLFDRLGELLGMGRGTPEFDESAIRDDWFRVHFGYAAGVVAQWLGEVMAIERAHLLDFGCGDGITDLGVRLRFGPRRLTGVDIKRNFKLLPAAAKAQLGLRRLPTGLDFTHIEPGSRLAGRWSVDAIYSWSVFEHVERALIPEVAADLYALLPPGGWFFLQIEPLYHSPYGSHLGRFVRQPWAHLLHDEGALWEAVRLQSGEIPADETDLTFTRHGPEGYKRVIFDEYRRLNRLTADELVQALQAVGFEVVKQERRQVGDSVPAELLSRYDEATLRTNEILLLLRKPPS